jgi:hypothetical protein
MLHRDAKKNRQEFLSFFRVSGSFAIGQRSMAPKIAHGHKEQKR